MRGIWDEGSTATAYFDLFGAGKCACRNSGFSGSAFAIEGRFFSLSEAQFLESKVRKEL
jgi:hypothetical protein